jgi:hypothetical protein
MEQVILSAALYCEREHAMHVSEEWLDGALRLLRSHGLQVRECCLGRTPVCREGRYALGDGSRARAAVRTGVLRYLELYCHPSQRRHILADWDGLAYVTFSRGYVYVGLPASSGVGHGELLRQTYALARHLGPWPYGIAYSRSSSLGPCMYGIGVISGCYPALWDVSPEEEDRISCWNHELTLTGRRRHLKGRLRDVYPANLLSAKHVRARLGNGKTLLTSGWGEFTRLDNRTWLWTVPEDDIPKVREALGPTKLLLCA